MNMNKFNHFVQRLARSRVAHYFLCFGFLLLVAVGMMVSTGCGVDFFGVS